MDRTPDLTELLVNPETVEARLAQIELGEDESPYTYLQECKAAIRKLQRLLAEANKYAAAPVDKGIPMHIYRAVCEQRDHELAERQRMTHRYEVEALRNKELEEQLATAKAEGAAEELERLAGKCGHQYVGTRRYTTPELLGRAAAIRAAIDSARAGGGR